MLLVEDDHLVRDLARTTLERHGYRVLSAAGPEEALRLARERSHDIALLLTDVRMPVIEGPELAARLRETAPDVRVLFMSGYAAESLTSESLRDAALLEKPFSPAVLTRAVRLVLDRA